MPKALVIACALAMPMAAYAQTPGAPVAPIAPVPPVPPVPPFPPVFAFSDDAMMFVSSELGGRTIVKGAPYAATAVNESKQLLSDGNRIERSSTIKLFRDSQGRTRQEQPSGVVFINDVVAGKRYVLNTQRKSARELRSSSAIDIAPPTPPSVGAGASATPPPPQPIKPHSQMTPEETRSWADEMRRWGRELAERARGEREQARERNVIITHSDTSEGPAFVSNHVEVIRMGDVHAVAPMPLAMPSPPGAGTTSTLGSREFDGVRADGKKTTWTIPAGQIGNKLPIEIVSERWYSPDLNLVVFSRHADPRSGERTYRLQNIKRDEPSAELFKVPADFELRPRPGERK